MAPQTVPWHCRERSALAISPVYRPSPCGGAVARLDRVDRLERRGRKDLPDLPHHRPERTASQSAGFRR
ncbi:MAG: hypothetical protein LBQ12_06830 [Deltaproteobacteria bacterium]|nr:hypothetical protein [Deltaproteobacteria bacterium]